MTAIDDKRNELPFLGNPVDEGAGSAEMDLGDGRGRTRDYENGSIYWTPQTGAHEVHGATSRSAGRTRKPHWTPQTGAHEVHGAIRDLWARIGWERSKLGYPVSDEMGMPGGRLSRFEGGEIDWTQAGGPKAILSSGFGDDNVGIPADG